MIKAQSVFLAVAGKQKQNEILRESDMTGSLQQTTVISLSPRLLPLFANIQFDYRNLNYPFLSKPPKIIGDPAIFTLSTIKM